MREAISTTFGYTSDGRVYEGQYLNGQQSGHGVIRGADGTIIQEGRYLDDEYVGK